MNRIQFLFILSGIIFFSVSCAKEDANSIIEGKWSEIKAEYINNMPICPGESDGFIYPQQWTKTDRESFEIPDEIIAVMSTCGLIDTYLDRPDRILGPWCAYCSYSSTPGVFRFNYLLDAAKEVQELFTRNDYIRPIMERYAEMIVSYMSSEGPGNWDCFEMLIANEKFISKLNNQEKEVLMVMSLKMAECKKKYKRDGAEPRHIMTSIMLADKFAPFIEEVERSNGLNEWMWGYEICSRDGVVEKYAIQYLNQ